MAKPTKTVTFVDFIRDINKGQLANPTPSNTAPAEVTYRAATRVALPPVARHYMNNIANSGLSDGEPDGVPNPTPAHRPEPNIQNLPAIVSKNLQIGAAEPQWHMVKNLPGMYSTAIRALGKQIFRQFTSTPIEEIQVLSTLTNHEMELKSVLHSVRLHGHKNDRIRMEFERLFPGYAAEIAVYDAFGYTFVLVEDPFGQYIYSWPNSTRRIS